MRQRHKSPSLVSMWMLDVFCCALGCVILLWVLESLSSAEQTRKAKTSLEMLDKTRSELVSVRATASELEKRLNSDIQDLKGRLAIVGDEKDRTKQALSLAEKQRDATANSLAAMSQERDEKAELLAKLEKDRDATKDDLKKTGSELALSNSRVKELLDEMRKKNDKVSALDSDLVKLRADDERLAKLLRAEQLRAETLSADKKMADDAISDLDAKYRKLQKESTETAAAMKSAGKLEDELSGARGVIKDLKKQIDDRNATIIDLENKNTGLRDKTNALKAESESRFAGIAMTGKNVVFVVDISGSMAFTDEKTPNRNKWPGVIDTVGKVMRSLPDLEQFQIIVFSRTAKYLLPKTDWQPYKGESSVKLVTDALKDTQPGGDTNIYEAFDLAFQKRDTGLDTVYFFSDGLPTSGPGISPELERTIQDNQRIDILSRHLRNTLNTKWNAVQNGKKVRINAIGFFYESPDVGAFLWSLARENDGSFVGMSKP